VNRSQKVGCNESTHQEREPKNYAPGVFALKQRRNDVTYALRKIMQILPYTELEDKSDIYLLWQKSFGWPATPDWHRKQLEQTSRLKGGPIGMCALEDGKLLGFVGIMTIPTRTKDRTIEQVGGIWGIATRPSARRRGTARKLLEESENWMRKHNYRIAMLTTSRAIVAHKWYESVGYKEIEKVNRLPFYYKLFSPPRNPEKYLRRINQAYDLDFKQVSKLFNRFTEKRSGFTIRTADDLKPVETLGVLSRDCSISTESGYLLARESTATIRVGEVFAESVASCRELIKFAEARAQYAVGVIHPDHPVVLETLEKMSYKSDPGSYDVVMWKSLDGTAFDDLYDGSFYLSRNDWF
jgi:ribosomal protein S18 acetylase RimI-like enzyme